MATDSMTPFPGLRPFGEEEDYLFFGREDQTNDLLKLLRTQRFLAVVGTSGSGKSSLVRAGMLPALYGGTMAGAGSDWETVVFRPGGDPLLNLAEAMIAADLYDPEDAEAPFRIRATLSRSRQGLVQAVEYSDLPRESNLLIVVDQFEELFRYRGVSGKHQEQASAFVKLLLNAARTEDRSIFVVITMRSDYLGDCAHLSGLAEAVNDGKYLIPKLTRDQRRDAIVKPAAVGGGKISESLVQQLLNDVGEDADQLPILQHALMRIWDFWQQDHDEGEPVALRHYDAVGGIANALSNHADEVYDDLPTEESRGLARKVFQAITERGGDERGIRRPTRMDKLCEIVAATPEDVSIILDAYRQVGRTFVMPLEGTEITAETVVDISHESLMRVWRRLSRWVEEESQNARVYTRLSETASLYHRDLAGVYRDPDLAIALSWREQAQPNSAWARRYRDGFTEAIKFLEESYETTHAEEIAKEESRERELEQAKLVASLQARAKKRLSVLLGCIAIALVASVIMYVDSLEQREVAVESRAEAEKSAAESQRLAKEAAASEVEAQKQATIAEENAIRAEKQAKEAEDAREQASLLAEASEKSRREGRRDLYFSELFKTLYEPDENKLVEAKRRFVNHWGPRPGLQDLRGWEWFYLSSRSDWIHREGAVPASVFVPVAFEQNGEFYYQLVSNYAIEKRDAVTHELISRIFFDYQCHGVVALPDREELVVACRDGVLRTVDATSGIVRQEYRLKGRADFFTVQHMICSEDGRKVFVANPQRGFVVDLQSHDIWEMLPPNGESQQQEDGLSPLFNGTVMGSSGESLIFPNGNGVIVAVDISEKQFKRITEIDDARSVSLSAGDTHLAVGREDGLVSILNTEDYSVLHEVELSTENEISKLQWCTERLALVAVDSSGRQFGVQVDSDVVQTEFPKLEKNVFSFHWTPHDSQMVWVLNNRTLYLTENPFTPKQVSKLNDVTITNGRGRNVIFTSDGKYIITTGAQGTQAFDRKSGELIKKISEFPYLFIEPTNDETKIVASRVGLPTIIFEIGSWEIQGQLFIDNAVCAAWNPTGTKFVIGRQSNVAELESVAVSVFDASDPSEIKLLGEFNVPGSVFAVAWSPSGKNIVVTARAGFRDKDRVFFVDAERFEVVQAAGGLNQTGNRVKFLNDTDRVLVSGNSGLDMIDFSVQPAIVKSRNDLEEVLDDLYVDSDGKRAVARSPVTGQIKVFDVESLADVMTIIPDDDVAHLEWNNTGDIITATTADLDIMSWNARDAFQRLGSFYADQYDNDPTVISDWNRENVESAVNAFIENGDWESADLVSRSAYSDGKLGETDPVHTNWWISPLFDAEFDEVTELENQQDFFAEENLARFKGSWRRVNLELNGSVDFNQWVGKQRYKSIYAMSRIYSPRDGRYGIFMGADDFRRLWINGNEISSSEAFSPVILDGDFVYVDLKKGWNTCLIKVFQTEGDFGFQLRVTGRIGEIVQGLIQNGDFTSANRILTAELESDPENDRLRYLRCQINRWTDNWELALEDLTLLLESQSSSELTRWRGELLARAGDSELAAKLINDLLEQGTKQLEPLFQLASLYRMVDQAKSDALLLKAIRQSDFDPFVIDRAQRELETFQLLRDARNGGSFWRFKIASTLNESWASVDFDDSTWRTVNDGEFKSLGGLGEFADVVYARREFHVSDVPAGPIVLGWNNNPAPMRVLLNGVPVFHNRDAQGTNFLLGPRAREALRDGKNVLSVVMVARGDTNIIYPRARLYVVDRPLAFGDLFLPEIESMPAGKKRDQYLGRLAWYYCWNRELPRSIELIKKSKEGKTGLDVIDDSLGFLQLLNDSIDDATSTFLEVQEQTKANFDSVFDIPDPWVNISINLFFMNLNEVFNANRMAFLKQLSDPSRPFYFRAELALREGRFDDVAQIIDPDGTIHGGQQRYDYEYQVYLLSRVFSKDYAEGAIAMETVYRTLQYKLLGLFKVGYGIEYGYRGDKFQLFALEMMQMREVVEATAREEDIRDVNLFKLRIYSLLYVASMHGTFNNREAASQAVTDLLQTYIKHRHEFEASADLHRLDAAILWMLAKADSRSLPAVEQVTKGIEMAISQRDKNASDWKNATIVDGETRSSNEVNPLGSGRVKVEGEVADHDVYSIRIRPQQKHISAIEVGFLADLDLPWGGPGRHTNGNVHLTRIQLFRGTDSTWENELELREYSVSYCQSSLTRSGIAVKGGRPWGVLGQRGYDVKLVVNLSESVELATDEVITVRLEFLDPKLAQQLASIVRFRTLQHESFVSVPEYLFLDSSAAVDTTTIAALVMYKLGNFDQAEEYVRLSEAENNLSLYGWILLANLEKKKGNLDAATKWYDEIEATSEKWARGEPIINSLFDEYFQE